MEEKHLFRLKSVWTGGEGNGEGEIRTEDYSYVYGKPEGTGRSAGRTSPEELLVAAVASCYSIALGMIAKRRGVPLRAIEMTAEGEVVRSPNQPLRFAAVRLWPRLCLDEADHATCRAAEDAAREAERHCLICDAMRGNVAITITPIAVAAMAEPA